MQLIIGSKWTLKMDILFIFHKIDRSLRPNRRSCAAARYRRSAHVPHSSQARARTVLSTAHSPIENSCKQTEARKGEARTKPRFQTQITLSKPHGSEQNLNCRFMAMRSNKSKKKFAKRSSKSRESKITRKSTQKCRKRKTQGIDKMI